MVANLLPFLPFVLSVFPSTVSAAPPIRSRNPPLFYPSASWENREISGAVPAAGAGANLPLFHSTPSWEIENWQIAAAANFPPFHSTENREISVPAAVDALRPVYRPTRQTIPDWIEAPARRSRLQPTGPTAADTAEPINWPEYFTKEVFVGAPYNIAAHQVKYKPTLRQILLYTPKDAVKWVVKSTPKEAWYGLLWAAFMRASFEGMVLDKMELPELSELLASANVSLDDVASVDVASVDVASVDVAPVVVSNPVVVAPFAPTDAAAPVVVAPVAAAEVFKAVVPTPLESIFSSPERYPQFYDFSQLFTSDSETDVSSKSNSQESFTHQYQPASENDALQMEVPVEVDFSRLPPTMSWTEYETLDAQTPVQVSEVTERKPIRLRRRPVPFHA
ncbi:hypothetical protein BJ508DRAFT_312751 [Ascobolus immersus RN42]|uniref:Uncharacterized protein n=1 Tax=Ascobolus immersus RN42 TaxID=1160509 RepID=A0A3N4HL99_ASCIM|nr:hypothetical protein BJ508DRAFT_312751 [Ascobolus immersus RN42]